MNIDVSNAIIARVLREARRVLQQKGWTKFAIARNDRGEAVNVNSAAATSFSLSGALVVAWRAVDPENEDFYFPYFEKKFAELLSRGTGFERTYTQWNDRVATSRDEVLALIDELSEHLAVEDALIAAGDAPYRQGLRSA